MFDLYSLINSNIVIIGDVMLDSYVDCQMNRFSDQAPIPILDAKAQHYVLGGAANVAANIKSLESFASLIGVVGNDQQGDFFKILLEQAGIYDYIITDDLNQRPTTVKTRYVKGDKQIIRVDRQSLNNITWLLENQITEALKSHSIVDAVVIEDYDKGTMTPSVIKDIISYCNQNDILIAVDPKFKNIEYYKNIDILKLNKKQLQNALKITGTSTPQELKQKQNIEYLIVTLAAEGMDIYSSEGKKHLPIHKEYDIIDVSGAGDTVISVVTLMMTNGIKFQTACEIANIAANIVCGKPKTSTLSYAELLPQVEKYVV